jgi:hypothetical protein
MSKVFRYLLLDGAVLRGHTLMESAQQSNAAIPLYSDLGSDACTVGPWLWPEASLAGVGSVELPARQGVSELHSNSGPEELQAHFANIRHIETHDGQRYFFRYADMRALAAMRLTLDDAQWAFLAGPIHHWAFIDRHGEQRVMVDGQPKTTRRSVNGLCLAAKQLATLLDAGLPDQLCLAVEELDEPQLTPSTNPHQFDCIEAAAQLIRQEGIEAFALQRAIARQAVLLGNAAIESPSFLDSIHAARKAGNAQAIDAWAPQRPTARNGGSHTSGITP